MNKQLQAKPNRKKSSTFSPGPTETNVNNWLLFLFFNNNYVYIINIYELHIHTHKY